MITKKVDFDAFIDRALKCESIAIDTEFVWERTFYPCLGLIQAALPDGECVLIDPLELSMEPLGKILSNPSITIILHDAIQDLQILYSVTGVLPCNIFDTRLAAGFAGMASTISLQNLLSELLDIDIPKGESRSNWLKRPLSDEQLKYALDDVKYMHQIKSALEARAESSGVSSWLKEDLLALDNSILYLDKDIKIAYQRVKYFSKLNRRELGVLRELAAWREEAAKFADLPRRHLMRDETLISLATNMPASKNDLLSSNILYGKKEKYASDIIKAIEKGQDIPIDECPELFSPPTNRNAIKRRVQRVKDYINKNILKYGVDSQLVATRSEFEELANPDRAEKNQKSRLLKGWRCEFLGEEELGNLQK